MTNSVVVPEMVNFSMVGGSSGIIQLTLSRVDSQGLVSYNKSVNVTYGASASTFYNALSTFNSFSGYNYIVNRYIYDASNNTLQTTTGAARIDYIVSIYWLRNPTLQAEKFSLKYFSGYTGTFVTTPMQEHSPVISGTFTLKFGGYDVSVNNSTSIPYNVSWSSLQAAIRGLNITGTSNIEVSQSSNYSSEYATNWTIKYKQYNGVVPAVEVSGALLSGGASSPTI